MSERFHMENQVESCYCLGMSMKHKEEQGVLAIEKRASFTDVLKRFDMSNFKPIAIMMKTGKWLNQIVADHFNTRGYPTTTVCLIYISVATRTNLLSALEDLSQHMAKPGKEHQGDVKRGVVVITWYSGYHNCTHFFRKA